MKLLLDQNLSFKLVAALADIFPGSSHVRLLGLDRSDDLTIWSRAAQDGFALVTLDGDFAELSMLRNNAPKILLLEADLSVDCLEID